MAFIEEESIKILFHSRLFVPSLTPGHFYLKFGHFSNQWVWEVALDPFLIHIKAGFLLS